MRKNDWKTGLVSIIMPAYNAGQTIQTSIDSVLTQTYPEWELLIINDCSTDNTEAIVKRNTDKRIRYFPQQNNVGVAMARNYGIKKAKGQYIAFLDSDDIWLPDKLNKQVNFMLSKKIGFSYAEYRQFKEDLKHIGPVIHTNRTVAYRDLLKGNDIGCLTVMIDRFVYPDIYMPKQHHEDYITWLNLLKKGGKAYSLQEDVARYRVGNKKLTGNKWKSLLWTWKVYRKSQDLSVKTSLRCMYFYISKGLRKHFLIKHRGVYLFL